MEWRGKEDREGRIEGSIALIREGQSDAGERHSGEGRNEWEAAIASQLIHRTEWGKPKAEAEAEKARDDKARVESVTTQLTQAMQCHFACIL